MQTDESGAPWPYDRIEDTPPEPPSKPTWECPEGICVCGEHRNQTPREHSVLLCDPDGRRMPGARCRVLLGRRVVNGDMPYADAEGWVTVAVRGDPKTLDLEWAPASLPREAQLPYRREYCVELAPDDRLERARRTLANLDFFRHESLSECIAAFQRHYCYTAITGELGDVEAELETYHDRCMLPVDRPDGGVQGAGPRDGMVLGQRPTNDPANSTAPLVAGAAAGPSPGGRPVPQVAPTAAPAPPPSRGYEKTGGGIAPGQGVVVAPRRPYRIELFREMDGDKVIWAPAHTLKRTRDDLWYLEILRGSHTAVTFIGAGGVRITSNNPANGVTMDPGVWVDATPGSERRTIFFHGWRHPHKPANDEDAQANHTTLFEDGRGPAPLQVKVVNYTPGKDNHVDLWLNGPSCALNAYDEVQKSFNVQNQVELDHNFPIPRGCSVTDIIDAVRALVPRKGDRLCNLVINAHMGSPRLGAKEHELFVRLGSGLFFKDVEKWTALKEKVKYIWFVACLIGENRAFMRGVCEATQAWVAACSGLAPDRKVEPHHIDYQPTMYHWKPGDSRGRNDFSLRNELFASARIAASPDLRTSLAFNIVGRGR